MALFRLGLSLLLMQPTAFAYTTKCATWSPITASDFGSVDLATGSCIYGQAAAGSRYAIDIGNTCAVTNRSSDGVTAYECMCLTQADANGGDAAFVAMERKACGPPQPTPLNNYFSLNLWTSRAY